jgi:hypothetical protein
MATSDFRKTYAWNAALDLGPHLVRIAESLPDGESAGLAAQLRSLVIDAPASIAVDLATGSRTAPVAALRIVAALEVIERVYPALDTAAARAAADTLAERVQGPNFADQVPAPTAPAPEPTAVSTEAEHVHPDSPQ